MEIEMRPFNIALAIVCAGTALALSLLIGGYGL